MSIIIKLNVDNIHALLTYYSLILFDAATAETVGDTATVHQGQ